MGFRVVQGPERGVPGYAGRRGLQIGVPGVSRTRSLCSDLVANPSVYYATNLGSVGVLLCGHCFYINEILHRGISKGGYDFCMGLDPVSQPWGQGAPNGVQGGCAA